MYKYTIIEPDSGNGVYVNLITSQAGKTISRQPQLLGLVKEALEGVKLKGETLSLQINMGRKIGTTNIVTTNETDSIFYAQTVNKTVYSRFVKNRSLSPSNEITILLTKDSAGNYEITDTWIGPCSPPFPGDAKETKASRPFWEEHALIVDTLLIQQKSITKDCPY